MAVRPGQHVAMDGRVYHPYLRDWSRMSDRATIAEFLGHLTQVFSKETPVISRAHQQQYQQRRSGQSQQQAAGASPAGLPQLPPKQPAGSNILPGNPSNVSSPPPLPPKPGEEYAETGRKMDGNGPPLPPLPHEIMHQQRASSLSPSSFAHTSRTPTQGNPYPPTGYQSGRPAGPPLPPLPHEQAPHLQQYRAHQDQSPVSPISPTNGYPGVPGNRYAGPAPMNHAQLQQPIHRPMQQPMGGFQQQPQYQQQQQRQMQPYPVQNYPPQQTPLPPAQHKQAAPDLLTDPFDVAIPASNTPLPAPPVPPNPEKEHILHALSSSLVQQAQQKVNQNLAAIAPLQAQQQALRAAQERLDGEIRQLEHLDQALHNNEAILHQSIQDCDRTIATAKLKKQPPIDEVLIAPTMVANQLWVLCAEEAACREAMYVLQKANDRGRVSGNDFVRQMRGLGRDCFLKMALARKCARGMGLELREISR